MELIEAIEKRRSIREFDATKGVSRQELEEMIKAATLAPSWKNWQASRYYVVTSEPLLSQIKNECLSGNNSKNVENAPALIITTFIKDRVGFERSGEQTNEVGNGWGFYDLGLQNQNLLLKAEELGIDTLVMGLRDANKIREKMNIDENEIIVSVIGVGHRNKDFVMPPRKSVEEVAKFL